MQTLSIVGILGDVVLPGEELALDDSTLEPASIKAARKHKADTVLALPLDFAMQLPGFVVGRVGTVASVVSLARGAVRLRGERRARVVSVDDRTLRAEVELLDPPDTAGVARALAAALHTRPPSDSSSVAAMRAISRAAGTRAALARWVAEGDPPDGPSAPAPTVSPIAELARLRARVVSGDATAAERAELVPVVAELAKALDVGSKLTERTLVGPLEIVARKLEALPLTEAARLVARERITLLADMPRNAHDFHTYLAHLQLLADLPWGEPAATALDIDEVATRLDRDHHGLDKPKRRILEHLAVRKLGGSSRGMVLCFVGPPGVGKTSLARSIADGLGRSLVRVPLGGVHDECEIRGHRQSFHAATPGRIILGMRTAGRVDPVMLLDELDKIGRDTFRSPAAALLEVLDPEQSHAFSDNFLSAPYDLSRVLCIATANDIDAVMPALRDRLEVVELDGYTTREKLHIARRHLLPRLATAHGLACPLDVSDDVIVSATESYTREPGVRELERVLAAVHRARAVETVRNPGGASASSAIELAEIRRVHGPPRFRLVDVRSLLPVGAAHGLSVLGDGSGAVLPIEVVWSAARGRAPALHLTGLQGEVMRESARAALSRLHTEAASLGIGADLLDGDLHVHLPEGGVKKEGPSAGVAVYLAMRSALTGVAVRGDVAWTGEITLHGRVLAVGGVRAKVLAAERAGLRTVALPEANRIDAPDDAKVEITFAAHLDALVRLAFAPPPDATPASPAAA